MKTDEPEIPRIEPREPTPQEMLSRVTNDLIVVMQSAWIEWQHGRGAEAAMKWVENQLEGPGNLPTGKWATDAQCWWGANNSNPLGTCWCGKPASRKSIKGAFCCSTHEGQAGLPFSGDPVQSAPGPRLSRAPDGDPE